MKTYRTFSVSLLLCLASTMQAQPREVVNLNYGWDFARDSLFTQSYQIDVPHDFQIEQPWVAPSADERADNSDVAANIKSRLSARGFKEMGAGWYRKIITPDATLKGRRILLDFEGIMYVGDVWLNGKHIGGTDYGYVGFQIDITQQLHYGQPNELIVKAHTMTERNSRWYTGGGLFRNVSLINTSADLYFERHPLYITTRDNQFVNISADVTNRTKNRQTLVRVTIYDPEGRQIVKQTASRSGNPQSRTQNLRLAEIEIPKPQLWDTEHPNLYTAKVELLYQDGTVADEVSEQFGIRTIEYGPAFGLKLNGQKVLLKGYANHHTLGALGAAAYPRAIEKRIQMMKQFGINHIRTSHNPYSRDFIRLCDKYGILVVDELYDKWTQQHTGGRVPFMNHWAQDVTEWITRDRNSPSVVMWSLGNELQQDPNQPFGDFGVTCYKMMRPVVHRYDSTRQITVAMHPRYRNWQTDSLPCDLAMQTDIQAYNYRYMYFPGDRRRFPWMTFYQSEASINKMGPNWFEMDLDKVVGLAYWGAIDYLGESQGWPAKGWAQGVFDIALDPKPKAYFMKSFLKNEPLVRIAVVEDTENDIEWNGIQTGNDIETENWNRAAGSKVNLYTYTNGDEVELLLNGKRLGRRTNPTDPENRNRILWKNIAYQAGRLEAVAYKQGKVIARHTIETTGKAVKLIASPDNSQWKADGQDLQHIRITAVDSKGRRVFAATDELQFEVEGDARIIAVTNGDITSEELNVTNHRRLWQGSAMVILRAGQQPSKISLKTISHKYKTVITKFETK
ncbi:glycoside hydrolase family 2 TIM barrel-domain containing protein [Prevotella sp. P6B4]|uniref:glycoside hydrolase family 2 TIM barrel-domain containing protein n=1 Tax=Prevotella sp. P6B4 TaxID=1410614 RepID=UPI0009E04B85|nr:glycoside hydrolase family 2 TIM barrel-domain containing protein [Prevotella sp. P6B4]